jgi:hypothetical protein
MRCPPGNLGGLYTLRFARKTASLFTVADGSYHGMVALGVSTFGYAAPGRPAAGCSTFG